MKLILTGTTGFIGHEVLTQALSHPSLTSLITLTRHPLPPPLSTHPKLHSLLINDFSTYPPSILSQLSGADACIWCIGAKSTSPEISRTVTLDYALAAIQAFSQLPRNGDEKKKFRFVFTSGILAVREGKPIYFPFAKEARRIAGETETKLLEFGEQNQGVEVYIARPSGVTPKERGVVKSVAAAIVPLIRVNELAAAMLDLAVHGAEKRTLENGELVARGREVLAGGGRE
ncbi:hypothetical protein L207DRAFT_439990 [Hyaloscypha variabilis F]|uniref:NAD(P)-binding domain-containing protein n=1 Tax=Hyaloscypha variabilis (strain UAMH 11265 / GT02V1 / F) TaxID=1149755 RepID=A0A2J6R2S5_HYAVF|nr:hypothetical protein L207DRAFT_439990 [Hyaloscypha variabilis F]